RTECLQAEPSERLEGLFGRTLAAAGGARPVKIDVLRGLRPIDELPLGVDALALRPGLDGACRRERCLAPWQLVAPDAVHHPTPPTSVPDARFGVSLARLEEWLGGEASQLVAIETTSLLLTRDAEPLLMSRLAPRDVTLDAASLRRAESAAQAFIVASQRQD